ncbi:carbohydrate kinase [Mucilaginibacter sp. MD40]|uniref:sugar kinase n=1 Tax=Mucilaginibacter sp. MD40 TaxID=2029590 RepID=UPI000BACD887|nr:sugar kinase [Mucilaginibacter sp. MD40]PAW93867.1 carbohydrate kinase [Mucilaginibacter sp. MD40]
MAGKVLTFGELLLRFCPDADSHWLNNNAMPFHVGGAELNVATALAHWNVPVKYFTALPDNGLTEQLINYLQKRKIDTSAIVKSDGRLGTFYLTKGKDMKHDAVIYDRAESSFAKLKTGTVNWDEVLQDVSWFHFSAICPALSPEAAELCEEVLKAASDRGIFISVDLNYRAKLWQYGKQPFEVMPRLAHYCDLIMGNIWAAEKLLGIPVLGDIHESGQKSIYLKQAQRSSEDIQKAFTKCKVVANTFRFDSRDGIDYYTTIYADNEFHHSAEYHADNVVDKVGSGDCFMAGLIYGLYNQLSYKETLDFATAAAFAKLFIEGDATTSKVDDVLKTIRYEN